MKRNLYLNTTENIYEVPDNNTKDLELSTNPIYEFVQYIDIDNRDIIFLEKDILSIVLIRKTSTSNSELYHTKHYYYIENINNIENIKNIITNNTDKQIITKSTKNYDIESFVLSPIPDINSDFKIIKIRKRRYVKKKSSKKTETSCFIKYKYKGKNTNSRITEYMLTEPYARFIDIINDFTTYPFLIKDIPTNNDFPYNIWIKLAKTMHKKVLSSKDPLRQIDIDICAIKLYGLNDKIKPQYPKEIWNIVEKTQNYLIERYKVKQEIVNEK